MDSNDPRMMILDADPAKYIRTPSGAVVVMIKAAEGYAAYFLGLRMFELVKAVFPICSFMPIEILSLLVPKKTAGFFIPAEVSKVFYPRLVFGGLNIVNILGTAAAAAVCVILACILLEAVLSVLLFVFLTGSRHLAIYSSWKDFCLCHM